MKKNLVIQWISGVGLLLGSAVVAQAAPSEVGARNDSTVAEAPEESSAEVADALRCDEPRIRSCHTECVRHCERGPRYHDCSTRCERDCHTRHCR